MSCMRYATALPKVQFRKLFTMERLYGDRVLEYKIFSEKPIVVGRYGFSGGIYDKDYDPTVLEKSINTILYKSSIMVGMNSELGQDMEDPDTILSSYVAGEKNQIKQEKEDWRKYCEHIYYINLDKRTDRLEHMKNVLSKFNINATRWAGVTKDDPCHRLNKGQYGCKLSHVNLIRHALENGYERIMILEDDIDIRPEFEQYMNSIVSQLKSDEYDIFYLYSYMNKNMKDLVINRKKGILGTHAYIVNRHFYRKFIEVSLIKHDPIDFILSNTRLKCYTLNNPVIYQVSGYSDITLENRKMGYKWFCKQIR